jgi:preprotein translocase subunit SecY
MAKASKEAEGPGLAVRLAVTILVPVAVVLGETITLPGIDGSALPRDTQTANLGIFALGVMPFISAMILVETLAAVWAPWAALRHGGPAGRRKLGRAAALLGVALAVFQAWGVVRLWGSLGLGEPGIAADMRMAATLVAGSVCQVLLAELCAARGLASGLGLLIVVPPITNLVRMGWGAVVEGKAQTLYAGIGMQVALVALVTWHVLRAPRIGSREAGSATYREPAPRSSRDLTLPIPASGLVPIVCAYYLIKLPASLVTLPASLGVTARAWSRLVAGEVTFPALMLVVVAALGVLLSWLFNQPARVAAVIERARTRGGSRPELLADARAALQHATWRTLVVLIGLLAIGSVTRHFVLLPATTASIAFATALALDVVAEWRARRDLGDLTPVWPEHRPYAIAAAREALTSAEIAVFARGERLRTLLQFGGPFVPIDLMVPRAHAKRATEILKDVLGSEADLQSDRARAEATTHPPKQSIARSAVIQLAALAALTLGVPLMSPWTKPPSPVRRAVNLELVAVDDEHEIGSADDARRLADDATAKGITMALENAPIGPGRSAARHYARVYAADGESLEHAYDRFVAWAAKLTLPEGDRLGIEAVSEYDEQKDRFAQVGWRTYLLTGPSVITAADVVDAAAFPSTSPSESAHVSLQLSREGGKRFEDFTGGRVNQRLAILIDGRVVTAPVVLQRIPGGTVSITMGTGDRDEKFAAAKELAERLLGR